MTKHKSKQIAKKKLFVIKIKFIMQGISRSFYPHFTDEETEVLRVKWFANSHS